MNRSPGKTRRLVFILSGAMDAAVGAVLLLLGSGLLPLDVTAYGFRSWHAIVPGGLLFLTGVWFVIYNLSRWEE